MTDDLSDRSTDAVDNSAEDRIETSRADADAGEGLDGDDARAEETTQDYAGRSVRIALMVALTVIVLDQITKAWARSALADGEVIDLGVLDLNLVFNTGASFGFGSRIGPFIGSVAALVAVGLIVYARTIPSRFSAALLGAIAGGAIGNVLDRLFRSNPAGESGFMRGAVIDFVDLRWWPVFNVADMAVVCGAILLVLVSLREG